MVSYLCHSYLVYSSKQIFPPDTITYNPICFCSFYVNVFFPVPSSVADEVPNRPGANRPEVITQALGGWSMNIPNGQVNMNMGLGFFPSLFGLQFQSFAHQSSTVDGESAGSIVVTEQQQFLERILVALGSLMIICLIIW